MHNIFCLSLFSVTIWLPSIFSGAKYHCHSYFVIFRDRERPIRFKRRIQETQLRWSQKESASCSQSPANQRTLHGHKDWVASCLQWRFNAGLQEAVPKPLLFALSVSTRAAVLLPLLSRSYSASCDIPRTSPCSSFSSGSSPSSSTSPCSSVLSLPGPHGHLHGKQSFCFPNTVIEFSLLLWYKISCLLHSSSWETEACLGKQRVSDSFWPVRNSWARAL